MWRVVGNGRLREGNGIGSDRRRHVRWVMMEHGIGGVGTLVRRERSGGWEVTNRLYGAVGENSIDFLKILYRLFRNTL